MVFYRAHILEAVKIVEWCKKNHIRVVFDTDDALDLVPPENLNYKAVQPRLPLYESLLRSADVVTTTTETLAEHLRQWNPNVTVIPNSVDPEEWTVRAAKRRSRASDGPAARRILPDLAVALDAVRELQKKHPFTFVLQGICKEPTLEELMAVLRARWGKAILRNAAGQIHQALHGQAVRHPLRVSSECSDRGASAKGLRFGAGHRHRAPARRPVQSPQELHQVLRIRDVGSGHAGVARAAVFRRGSDHREE